MAGVVRFALRHSRMVIGAWVVAIVLCAAVGFASGNAFTPTSIVVPGSESERAFEAQAEADFGITVNVLLTGPKRELRRQGAALTAHLRGVEGVRVASPFDDDVTKGGARRRELTTRGDDFALFIVDVKLRPDQSVQDAAPPIRSAIAATVREPVTARATGLPAIAEGLTKEAFSATRAAEKIAAPLLILVLLLVFRSPVAAAIPGLLGLGAVVACTGLVQGMAHLMTVDEMALSLASMMGLALGVDYALLLVSRYREHRRANPDAVDANIEAATLATGRTIAFAAVLLIAVMGAAALVSVGSLLRWTALAIGVVTVFSALTTIAVAPALLKLLDPWLERWRLPSRRGPGRSRFARRQPILVPVAALIALLLLAAPSIGIAPGAPDVRLLPEDAPVRVDYEQISEVVGPGFGATFEVTIESRDHRPLTTARSLSAMARLERRLRADRGVADVFGPGALTRLSDGVEDAERGLTGQSRGLARLERGLSRATEGSRQAGAGAARLHAATGETHQGAERLAAGLRGADDGSGQLVGGIGQASGGSDRLARGTERASTGAGKLSGGLAQAKKASGGISNKALVLQNDLQTGSDQLAALRSPLTTVEERLAGARQALDRMTTGRDDPQFQAALQAVDAASKALTGRDPSTGEQLAPSYEGVAAGITDAEGQLSLGLYLTGRMGKEGRDAARDIGRLADGAARLEGGIERLSAGNADLARGLARLSSEGGQLPSGLGELSDGAGLLVGGLGQVETGAGKLATGLGGSGGSAQLTGGLERMESAVERQRGGAGTGELERVSPGLFESGVLPLAIADGMRRPTNDRTRLVLDTLNGGRTARILVIPSYTSNDPRIDGLHERISRISHDFDGRDFEVALGGPGASLGEFKDATAARLPLLIAAFTLVSFLILVVALRAVPLALLCVGLNLLTVGVAFGVLQLGFGSSDPLLGGPGYVDVIGLSAIVAVVFALSIDYQIFLLARIREEYAKSGSSERAVTAAIGSTGSVIAGAAAIMVTVFLAFCTSKYIGIREIGIGLAVAVLLDATIVRLVLLPAGMRLLGDRTWWLPAWLDRRMPNLSL